MLPKNCGKLLYNAVRETLETMAFADVVPCSIKVAGEEFAQDDDFAVLTDVPVGAAGGGWGDEPATQAPADTWGTATPVVDSPVDDFHVVDSHAVDSPAGDSHADESWGDSPEPTMLPEPTTLPESTTVFEPPVTEDDWGAPPAVDDDAAWGRTGTTNSATDSAATSDPWGDAGLADACT